MAGEIEAAIQRLETELTEAEQMFREAERNVYGKRMTINELLRLTGQPPRYPTGTDGAGAGGSGAGTPSPGAAKPAGGGMSIRSDSFYGKRQQTAIREYLEMRKGAGLGAAKPSEIFEALREGGFQYDAKEDETAKIGLRALLRKRSAYFHKLPNGAYGLAEWYPDAKKAKPTAAGGGQDGANADLSDDGAADDGEDDAHAA